MRPISYTTPDFEACAHSDRLPRRLELQAATLEIPLKDEGSTRRGGVRSTTIR